MNRKNKVLASLTLCTGFSAFGYEYDLSRRVRDFDRDPIDQVADADSRKTLKDFEDRILDLEEVQSAIPGLAIYCPRNLTSSAERKEVFRPALKHGDFYLLLGDNECTATELNHITVKPVDLAKNQLDIRLGHLALSPLTRYRIRAMYRNPNLQPEVSIRTTCTHYTLAGLWDTDYFVCPLSLPDAPASGFISFKVSALNGI